MTIFKNLFGTQKELPFNLHHPDISPNVEKAFECLGVQYWRMKNGEEFRLPAGRFKFVDAYLREHEMRMSVEMLKNYLDRIEGALNGANGKSINLTTALVTIHNMRTHANLGFEAETIQRLASLVYFDETEDLRDYEKDHGNKKIKDWLSDGKYSFFLTRPIDELLNIQGLSVDSLVNYIQQQRAIIAELTSEPLTQSTENS